MTNVERLTNEMIDRNSPLYLGVPNARRFVVINTKDIIELGLVKKRTLVDVNEFLCEEEYEIELVYENKHNILSGTYNSTDLIFNSKRA